MRLLTFFILLLINFQFLNAQGKITGKLISLDNAPIGYATVSISIGDSLVLGTITEEQGDFILEKIPFGDYHFEASFLGFKTYHKNISLNENNLKVKLQKIILEVDEEVLDEVVIRGEKSEYITKMDKKIFNVGNDIVSQGGDALDVLSQVPQVLVQPTGVVELRGNSSVQILINGRRSGITTSNALDQIDVSNIDRIEVITNPSAKFDASGTAGIINIVLKRAKGEGVRSQLRTEIGTPANYILLPSISYKGDNLNLFGNVRWRYSDYNGIYTVNQENSSPENKFSLDKNEIEDRHDDGLGYYMGGDYYFGENTSLTMAYYRSNTKDSDITNLNYSFEDVNSKSDFLRIGTSLEKRNYNQLEAGIDHTFKKAGAKISTYLQYDFWNSNKVWDLNTSGQFPNHIPSKLKTTNIAGSDDIAITSDFEIPIPIGKIEAGLKWEKRKVINDYTAENFANKKWDLYKNIDNDITYGERISAGYINFKGDKNSWEYMIGLRAENTNIDIKDDEGIYTDGKNYLNLFPSAFISKSITEYTNVQLGYSRRINRPSLWALYPFNELTDVNVIQSGNPDLNPSYTNGYELNLSSSFDKVRVSPGLYYRQTSGAFENYLIQDDEDFFSTYQVNIEEYNELGFEVSARYQPLDALNFNAEFNWSSFDQAGIYKNQDMSAEGTTWSTRLRTNADLGIATLMARFTYIGPRKNAQIDYLGSSDLSAGLNSSFFGNKLDVSIWFSNILDTRIRRSISEGTDFKIEQSSRRTGPRASLNLTYKWNYGKRDRLRRANRGNR